MMKKKKKGRILLKDFSSANLTTFLHAYLLLAAVMSLLHWYLCALTIFFFFFLATNCWVEATLQQGCLLVRAMIRDDFISPVHPSHFASPTSSHYYKFTNEPSKSSFTVACPPRPHLAFIYFILFCCSRLLCHWAISIFYLSSAMPNWGNFSDTYRECLMRSDSKRFHLWSPMFIEERNAWKPYNYTSFRFM